MAALENSRNSEISINLEQLHAIETRNCHYLAGKIISKEMKNRMGGFGNVIRSSWKVENNGLEITKLGSNIYLFCFSSEEDMNRIYKARPWTIMGSLMILIPCYPNQSVDDLDFSSAHFWLQIHGLPIGNLSKENAILLAKLAGTPPIAQNDLNSEITTENGFLRIFVSIDVARPLFKGFWLNRDNQKRLWISFRYERLAEFCYNCGSIGHGQDGCPDDVLDLDINSVRYGPWIRAPPYEPFEPIPVPTNSPNPGLICKTQSTIWASDVNDSATWPQEPKDLVPSQPDSSNLILNPEENRARAATREIVQTEVAISSKLENSAKRVPSPNSVKTVPTRPTQSHVPQLKITSDHAPLSLPVSHVFVKVDQLKPGTNGHALIVKVLTSDIFLQKKARCGGKTRIAECIIGDETGTILFTARNDQVYLMRSGSTVILRNAKIDMFKGYMRLVVDKWGCVEVTEPANFVVKRDNNLSQVEYELVNVGEE